MTYNAKIKCPGGGSGVGVDLRASHLKINIVSYFIKPNFMVSAQLTAVGI